MVLIQHAVAPVPALPEALAPYQHLVETLMAKDPAERYADAEAFLGALERVRA